MSWTANLPSGATAAQKSNNGLSLSFYPELGSGVVRDFKANSDNMTAVKVVQSFRNDATGQSAVGLRIAYRKKTSLTKDL